VRLRGIRFCFSPQFYLHTKVFNVLYNRQQNAVLVGLDVELSRQHAPYLVEALLGTLAPPLLDLNHNITKAKRKTEVLCSAAKQTPLFLRGDTHGNILAHAAGVQKACSPSCGSRAAFHFFYHHPRRRMSHQLLRLELLGVLRQMVLQTQTQRLCNTGCATQGWWWWGWGGGVALP
jgi:hypothetical protein